MKQQGKFSHLNLLSNCYLWTFPFVCFFSLKCLIQITVRHSTEVGLEGNTSLEGMSLQGTEAPTPGTGQQPMKEPTVKERKGVRRKSSQEEPVCTDHNTIPGGTGEGRRNQEKLSWARGGKGLPTCLCFPLPEGIFEYLF